tara:strand:+ start:86 stop:361 length:276 start_codon:yes stop_codon:yes gene_type:complete
MLPPIPVDDVLAPPVTETLPPPLPSCELVRAEIDTAPDDPAPASPVPRVRIPEDPDSTVPVEIIASPLWDVAEAEVIDTEPLDAPSTPLPA